MENQKLNKKALKTSSEILEEQKNQQQHPIQSIKKSERVGIIGFAPDSRNEARLDMDMDIWPLNELYMEMPILAKRANAWFQLHGSVPTTRDPNHAKALAELPCPVIMWQKHPDIPNSIEYPREDILRIFDNFGEGMCADIPSEYDRQYFTNTVSWQIALAVALGYKEIYIWGVNMAQDQEYGHQRPSCEFYLGWARGQGIKVFLPKQSDLLMSGYQYGYDEVTRGFTKSLKRIEELEERVNQARNQRIQAQNQAQNLLAQEQQLGGALENAKYGMNLGPRGYSSVRSLKEDKIPEKKETKGDK